VDSVTVIGAGIVGTSIAHRLARRTRVTLVDAALPTGGTGLVGMAWLNASNKRPRDYFDLNHAGVREYHRLKGDGAHPWIHLTGSLASAGYTPDLAGRTVELAEWGYRVERLRGADVARALGGEVVVPEDELFARYPDEGWVDAPAAVSWLREDAGDGLGCRFGAAVTGLEPVGGGFAVTLADGSRFRTDQVVNAAGPAADRVAALLGRRLPLAPTRGLTVRLSTPGVGLDTVLHVGAISIRPDGPGHHRIHSEAVDRRLAGDRAELVADLLRRATSVVPALAAARVVAEFAGVRPIPADSYSSIGRVAAIPGYVEAVTHSGVTLGPLVGRLVAGIVCGEPADPLLTDRFRPDRFDGLADPSMIAH
jgi:glycine/D-amino acid oxidase-like deaminating enzyme